MSAPLVDRAMKRSAVISGCGTYRYSLTREWKRDDNTSRFLGCVFVMLNPSTADAKVDDPTIRRCIAFANREGYDRLTVVNLCAYRATNPKDLPTDARVAEGPENYRHVRDAVLNAGLVVCAWGANARPDRLRPELYREGSVWCLGKTKDGHPRHPLYVRADQPLERFP